MKKKGQIAIFVIIGIVLIGVVAIFFVLPQTGIIEQFGRGTFSPRTYLKDCVASDVDSAMETLKKQGGSLNPESYFLYEDKKIEYLCYTSEEYKPCVVQQPLLVNHVEKEIKNFIEPKAQTCFDDLKGEYEKRGYSVSASDDGINVKLVPGRMNVEFLTQMTLTREGTQAFDKFSVSFPTELYDLLMISTSIVQFESTLGDSEPLLYSQYYPDLKIEKIKRERDKVYKVSNVVSGEEFVFGVRSLVWPAGYGSLGV